MHTGGTPGNLITTAKRRGEQISDELIRGGNLFIARNIELTTLVYNMMVFSSFSLHVLSGPTWRPETQEVVDFTQTCVIIGQPSFGNVKTGLVLFFSFEAHFSFLY